MNDDTVTLERLAHYLDSGRVPYDPSIEDVPENASQLATLERLRVLSGELLAEDAAADPDPDPRWISGVMERVRQEARSGRDIPLDSDGAATLHMTEGAVRGLIREAGDSVPGAVVISCSLGGDVSAADAPVRVEVVISALRGQYVPVMADEVREAVTLQLLRQTELDIEAVDIVVGDVHLLETGVAS
ncbi:hypothetical protein GCM10025867_04930 [Frondihabitans sucicola]|uniref:Asp23/Gls24 family envelope stress response protein n=1 Tax=Frondihabitans sucicola TaxID=1268041 RepID=A0ABN6XTB0_9MICO|nr:hypothetical protein [Frondihabitans sucicola]BDZ48252.1 hypothetical protein GCM10025867_04930 [Frondihabitans sucicola]